jgi:hypothetical protein
MSLRIFSVLNETGVNADGTVLLCIINSNLDTKWALIDATVIALLVIVESTH